MRMQSAASSRTPVPACPRRFAAGSSSRSSPPRGSGEPGSASAWRTRSSRGMAGASRWTVARAPGRSSLSGFRSRLSSGTPPRPRSPRPVPKVPVQPRPAGASPMPDPGMLLSEARRELARLLPVLDLLTGDLDGTTWRGRPVETEWSPIEIVCHLRDEEAEDFPARLRVVVAGGRHFAPIDPERWAEERHYRDADPREALGQLRTLRATNLRFLG